MASPMFLLLFTILASISQIISSTNVPSTNSYLSTANKIRLKQVIEPGLKSKDLLAIYSAVIGYELLEEVVPNKAEICKNVLSSSSGGNITPETAFYITSVWKSLKDCQGLSKDSITTTLISIIEKDTSTIPELYYAVSALSKLSHKFSDTTTAKLTTALQNALNKDDNLWTLGYVFHIASHLGSAGSFAFDRIEDAIIQADEVDGKFLQFEGGLHITSHIINGIYKLSMSLNKKPPLKPHQSVKLANYLLSRRSVQTPKGVVNLLSALTTLSNNKFENLVCITTTESGHIVSEEQPFISLKVCDILGKPLSPVPKVVASSAHIVEDVEVNLAVKDCKASPTDKTLFTYDFMKSKPVRGFYKVSFMADTVTNTITAKVLSKITVGYLEIGTGDADQTTQPKLTKVSYPEKYQTKIEADSQQKLVLKFLLKDAATSKPVRVHQAFVRLSPVNRNADPHKRDNEIIFVAEADTANVYKFEMPVGSSASNFGHKSGDYDLELIVGDAILSNPFQWTICTVSLKFPVQTSVEAASHSVSYKQKPNVYTTKPEIRHMFREPEKRPPAFVSNLFTGLCLAPALLLFILWAKLGVNISNFPLSLSAVLFHVGLGSIFVLFGVFWLKLNMFVTLRYLLGLGVVTFLAGNKLLSHVARKHKALR